MIIKYFDEFEGKFYDISGDTGSALKYGVDGWESIDNDGKKCVIEVLHFKNNHETNIIIDYGKISWLYKIGGCK